MTKKFIVLSNSVRVMPLVVMVLAAAPACWATEASSADAERYIAAVRQFADNVLTLGRDTYGPKHTPLFVDGLNVDTHTPVMWKAVDGTEWVISNLASQQNLFRTLDGLSALTGDVRYKAAAMEAYRYAFDNLWRDGLLCWGGHQAYNATADVMVHRGKGYGEHELKCVYPYYELMWQVDPKRTQQMIENIWAGHVLDWAILDFNRHGMPKPAGQLWAHEYKGGPVFFWGKGLTFQNAGSDLYYAAGVLSALSGQKEPLVWSKRLAHRYVETRNPKTGLGGYQFSQANAMCDELRHPELRGDRAQYQYGADFPGHFVVEGTLFPAYGDTPAVSIRICQLMLAEKLATDGREFLRWAVEEMTAWGKAAYRAKDNSFIPMLTDGTSMEGYVCKKDGYFGPKGRVLHAGRAQAAHMWAYCLAYRLSGDPFMWEMARNIARGNQLGDLGAAPGSPPQLAAKIGTADPNALLAFLELYRKTAQTDYLNAACKVGDNILKASFSKGFFVSSRHLYARVDSPEPLALLRLAATLRGKDGQVPAYVAGSGFFDDDYGTEGRKTDSFLYERLRSGRPGTK